MKNVLVVEFSVEEFVVEEIVVEEFTVEECSGHLYGSRRILQLQLIQGVLV